MGRYFHATRGYSRARFNGKPIKSTDADDLRRDYDGDPVIRVTFTDGTSIKAYASEVKEGRDG